MPRGAVFLVSVFFAVTINKYSRLLIRLVKSAGMYQRKPNAPLKSSNKIGAGAHRIHIFGQAGELHRVEHKTIAGIFFFMEPF